MSTMINTPVGIYDFNDNVVKTSRFQLLQWKHAIKLELKTGMKTSRGSVIAHVRKKLSAPSKQQFTDSELLTHIALSLKDINDQLAA